MKLKILPAEEKHIPDIIDTWIEFIDYHAAIDPLFKRSEYGHENFGSFVKELIDDESSSVFVAIMDRKVVGYSIVRLSLYPPVFVKQQFGEILDMAVRENYRRFGVGEKLLKVDIDWFKERGIDSVELRVLCENTIGVNFWRKNGFKEHMYKMEKAI